MSEFQSPAVVPGTGERDTRLTVTHVHGEHVLVAVGGVEIADYVYVPSTPPQEARKPYIHPLRTLGGALVSAFRPWDHRWHKGFQMTWSHVGDQNFWGGKTFSVEKGYEWRDNVGSMRHEGFDAFEVGEAELRFVERLTWVTRAGESWMEESRTIRVHGIDVARGTWTLDFATELRNVRGAPIELGSPTTHGRENAGYTGWFWRGPRSWTGGEILAAGGKGGEQMMGDTAEWLAIVGNHDEVDGAATMLVFAGTSSAAVPIRWFVRSEPFAAINPSPAFAEEIVLAPGESLALAHRVVVADGAWSRAELDALARERRP